MSDATLPDRIEKFDHALTAVELAELLAVSRVTVFKMAKTGRLPCFRIGSCVRFDPASRGAMATAHIGLCDCAKRCMGRAKSDLKRITSEPRLERQHHPRERNGVL